MRLPDHVGDPQCAAIERLRDRYGDDPDILAVVVIGSVARGEARPDSDVDCVFVVAEDERARRAERGEVGIDADDLGDGTHVGGQFVDMRQLRETAERGPEPARYAYTDAIVVASRVPELAAVVAAIPVYPERERAEKMTSFVSQLPVHLSYLQLAELSRNEWLLAQTAVELVLFAGRLILAHNRLLFPNRKQFLAQLERAPLKPAGFVPLARELSARPSMALARRFYDAILAFADWPEPPEGHWGRFIRDRETNWRQGPPALADS